MDDEFVRIAANIPKRLHADLRIFCFTRKTTIQDAVSEAISDWLKNRTVSEEAAR